MFSASKTAGPSGYAIQRSVRLRSSASAYFNRTFTTPTNNIKWTWSGWVKRGIFSTQSNLFTACDSGAANFFFVGFDATTNSINFAQTSSGTYNLQGTTAAVFRDPASWYHVVVVYDSANATSTDRFIIYINGIRQTLTYSVGPVASSTACQINSARSTILGALFTTSAIQLFDGYLTEVNFIDGQALTPTSFGAYNSTTGVWQPIRYSGTYGTNGFFVNFRDNTSTTTLGYDYSGNSNNWTANNVSLTAGTTYDSMLDVPTLTSPTNANFAVLNPLCGYLTLSDANLTGVSTDTSNERTSISTILVSSGKWYAETTIGISGGFNNQSNIAIGTVIPSSAGSRPSSTTGGVGYRVDGQKEVAGTVSAYGSSYTNNDVIGIALDCDSNTVTFYKNNTSQGSIAITSGLLYFICASLRVSSGTATSYWNFGQRPFSYTPPTGFVALNTYNLPTPTIANGAKQFAATTYTGTGATLTVANTVNSVNFQPDFVWIKGRSGATSHDLYDSVRGTTKQLIITNAAETTEATGLTAFGSTGFTVGALASLNTNAATYIAWQWKASNASAVSNTNGSITSSVSVNTTAGFSIVSYTGTGANATIGHGLGVAPKMVICKNRAAGANSWAVGHDLLNNGSSPWNYWMQLEGTAAQVANSTVWNNTAPTSSVFSVGTSTPTNNTNTMIAYCFAEIAGFSKFGYYTGNGAADGPFVYTGFRPRYVCVKRSNGVGGWTILDSSRDTYNVAGQYLFAETSAAEGSTPLEDFLSNGFKLRATSSSVNSVGTYIYFAFAENPFNYSLAR